MKVRAALQWTGMQYVVVVAIELIGLALLARLFTPAEMGAFAAALALVRLAMFISNFGLHTVIIRAEDTDPAFRANVLAIGLFAGFATFAIGLGALWLVPGGLLPAASMGLALVMFPSILINVVGSVANAHLLREMRFPAIFVQRLIAAALFQVVAVLLALAGMGPLAMAIAVVASTVAFVIGTTWATKRIYLLRPSFRDGRQTVGFASTFFVITTVHQIVEVLPTILLGRLADLSTLGIFTRANDLVTRANGVMTEVVSSVVAPYTFKETRAGADPAKGFVAALSRLTAGIWPIALMLSALSPPVVRVLLGDQWDAAIPVLQLLALTLLIRPVSFILGNYAVALGLQTFVLIRGFVFLLVTGVAVWLFAGAGLVAVVLALIGAQLIDMALGFVILWRTAGLSARPVLFECARSGVICAVAVAPVFLMAGSFPQTALGDLLLIFSGSAVTLFVWMIALTVARHPMEPELPVSLSRGAEYLRRRVHR